MEDRGWGGVDPRYCPSLPRRGLEGGEAGTGVGRAGGFPPPGVPVRGVRCARQDAPGAWEGRGTRRKPEPSDGAPTRRQRALRRERMSPAPTEQRRGRQVRVDHPHASLGCGPALLRRARRASEERGPGREKRGRSPLTGPAARLAGRTGTREERIAWGGGAPGERGRAVKEWSHLEVKGPNGKR